MNRKCQNSGVSCIPHVSAKRMLGISISTDQKHVWGSPFRLCIYATQFGDEVFRLSRFRGRSMWFAYFSMILGMKFVSTKHKHNKKGQVHPNIFQAVFIAQFFFELETDTSILMVLDGLSEEFLAKHHGRHPLHKNFRNASIKILVMCKASASTNFADLEATSDTVCTSTSDSEMKLSEFDRADWCQLQCLCANDPSSNFVPSRARHHQAENVCVGKGVDMHLSISMQPRIYTYICIHSCTNIMSYVWYLHTRDILCHHATKKQYT